MLWEQQYVDNSYGPCNHTNLWEDDYTDNDYFSALSRLPAHTIEVQRVTYDNYRIEPHMSRDMANNFTYYEYIQGPQIGYTLDKDGYFNLRKIPVPATVGDTYTFSGSWGLQRSQTASEFETSPTIIGARGVIRSMPYHFVSGDRGIMRRAYKDTKNVRVEYSRRGNDLETNAFELPDRYVKYVELYAMSMAREREGAGQNKILAAHFLQRYQAGVERIQNRMLVALRERTHKMGGASSNSHWPDLAKYPYHYPALPTTH